MNGKDIFLGLGYIDRKFIEEAEFARFSHAKARFWKRPVLIAALIAMLLMLAGCAAAIAGGRFGRYFEQKSGGPLTPAQETYLAENERIIGETQVQDQWTVELRSAISDGTTGYIILGFMAPEGVNLEPTVVDDHLTDSFGPGNYGMAELSMPKGTPGLLTASDKKFVSFSSKWEEDGDGKDNTKNMVLEFSPTPGVEYALHIENIVHVYDDEAYRQELLNGKYAGQTDVMFDSDEVKQMTKVDVLAEGTWDFTVQFDGVSDQRIELLTEPVKVMAYATRNGKQIIANIYETYQSYEQVEVTSVIVSPLSVTITYDCDAYCRFSSLDAEETYVVMKDGSRIETIESGKGTTPVSHDSVLDARSPIVLDQVDHVLLPDGTKIPVT